jgi:hypothetical protein
MISVLRIVLLFLVFLTLSIWSNANVPFQIRENFITGLSSPVFVTNADDKSRRLFILEQRGKVKVAQPGSSITADYLNLSSVVSQSGAERGLLGIAFHPNFSNNRRFFVYYTRETDGAIEIAEYLQNASNPNVADPNPVRIILVIPHPTFSNHNGGTIAFGPDGYLYIGTGDGGSGNDPSANSQNLDLLLGKMLRIDIDNASPPANYSIPPTNPFVGTIPGADEIYAYGLRNPYRFSFDRGNTNQLWVGDVGQNALEEVNVIVSGGNYGWRVYEGTQCTGLDPQFCEGGATPIIHAGPVFQYSRTVDASGQNRCSVTGGYVYRGQRNALPVGNYIYGDYCTGEVMMWDGSQQSVLRDTTNFNLVSFGEDEDGELYIVRQHINFSPNSGSIARIIGSNRANADFDGDGGTDLSIFRPSSGVWFTHSPMTSAASAIQFGLPTDIPTPEDFDGDGKTDFAVYRPTEGVWYVYRSSDSTMQYGFFGLNGDIPVAGDYDGDRRADYALYRPSQGVWYIARSATNTFQAVIFGLADDIPVNADYDGDGQNDIAIWRPSDGVWWRLDSSDGQIRIRLLGRPGDRPLPSDYDGDGRTDEAIFRPSTGEWLVRRTSDNITSWAQWGSAEDVPVAGDYDRDGRDDIAVWRPSSQTWWIIRSSNSSFQILQFGLSGDVPIPFIDRP